MQEFGNVQVEKSDSFTELVVPALVLHLAEWQIVEVAVELQILFVMVVAPKANPHYVELYSANQMQPHHLAVNQSEPFQNQFE